MKRCPTCHRVETDDTLVFCRTDGTALIGDPGSVSTEAGTVKFGSASVASETESSVLPNAATDAGSRESTARTTMLDSQPPVPRTHELSRPKRRKAIAAMVVIITVALSVSAYIYLSRKNQATIESVAVLPFVNASGNSDVEYLSDGMTESLITSLSQLPKLNVKARSSVFRYKGKEIAARQVGQELNVQAIVNGRVVQRGNDLTLHIELVDVKTETALWSGDYNRSMTNLVALQSEIVRDVSNKLQLKLSGADEQKLTKNYTANTEAYQLYLKGLFYWNKRNPKDLQKSIEYFQQAIALDPNYALAFAGLADAYSLLANFGGAPPPEAKPKAREAVLKALSLDNDLAEAHTALGGILDDYDHNFAGAEREYKRAIELNPNYATAHQWYGEVLARLGKHEESLAETRRALEIDPLSLIINRMYGENLLYARKYDEAIEQLKRTLELDPSFLPVHDSLGFAYQVKGNYAECVEGFAKFEELIGEHQYAGLMRESFAKGGWQGFLRAMTGERRPSNLPSYYAATFQVALGEKDKAFAELNKSYDRREAFMTRLKVDPRLDPLRSDPRFADLMHRMGL